MEMKDIKLILKSVINLKSSPFLDKGFYIEFDMDNLEREYYDINQNDFSYSLVFKSLFSSDVKSYFFMEFVNLFQDLMVGTYLNVL